jgi:hypothetical protein
MEIPKLIKLQILPSTDCNRLLMYRKGRDGCYNRNTWCVPTLGKAAVHTAVHVWTHAVQQALRCALYSRPCGVHFTAGPAVCTLHQNILSCLHSLFNNIPYSIYSCCLLICFYTFWTMLMGWDTFPNCMKDCVVFHTFGIRHKPDDGRN